MPSVILFIVILVGIIGAAAFLNLHKHKGVEDDIRAEDFEILEAEEGVNF